MEMKMKKLFLALILVIGFELKAANTHGLSIRDLIECGQLPKITSDGTLNLSRKGLVSLDGLQDIPNKESIVTLKLDHNQLTSVPAEIFNGLINLSELNLSYNQLVELPKGIFSGL